MNIREDTLQLASVVVIGGALAGALLVTGTNKRKRSPGTETLPTAVKKTAAVSAIAAAILAGRGNREPQLLQLGNDDDDDDDDNDDNDDGDGDDDGSRGVFPPHNKEEPKETKGFPWNFGSAAAGATLGYLAFKATNGKVHLGKKGTSSIIGAGSSVLGGFFRPGELQERPIDPSTLPTVKRTVWFEEPKQIASSAADAKDFAPDGLEGSHPVDTERVKRPLVERKWEMSQEKRKKARAEKTEEQTLEDFRRNKKERRAAQLASGESAEDFIPKGIERGQPVDTERKTRDGEAKREHLLKSEAYYPYTRIDMNSRALEVMATYKFERRRLGINQQGDLDALVAAISSLNESEDESHGASLLMEFFQRTTSYKRLFYDWDNHWLVEKR